MLFKVIVIACLIAFINGQQPLNEIQQFHRVLKGETKRSMSCVRGMKYTDCASIEQCRPSCEDPTGCAKQTFIQVCVEACVCPHGTVYSKDSVKRRCIKVDDCSPTCNQKFKSQCNGKGNPCRWNRFRNICKMRLKYREDNGEVIKCENPSQTFLKKGSKCPKVCTGKQQTQNCDATVRGCQCREDEWRSREGDCYEDEQCTKLANGAVKDSDDGSGLPPKCPGGLVHSDCGSCERFCGEKEPDFCTTECRTGCFCPSNMPFRHRGGIDCFQTVKCEE